MAKNMGPGQKSAVRSAAGKMAAIWMALEAAVRQRGGNDDAILQLDSEGAQSLLEKIAELLVAKVAVPIVNVAYQAVLTWVIAVCRFVSYVDPNITAANFQLQLGDLTLKEVIVVAIDKAMSTADVLQHLDNQGLRPATLLELLYWWLTNPNKHANCLVVALGQVWRGGVPYVYGRGVCRELSLCAVASGWGQVCSFAAVRK